MNTPAIHGIRLRYIVIRDTDPDTYRPWLFLYRDTYRGRLTKLLYWFGSTCSTKLTVQFHPNFPCVGTEHLRYQPNCYSTNQSVSLIPQLVLNVIVKVIGFRYNKNQEEIFYCSIDDMIGKHSLKPK